MGRYIVLAGHVTFALVAICLLTLITVSAELQVSGGDIILLTNVPQ
jgi:hypothetical protein